MDPDILQGIHAVLGVMVPLMVVVIGGLLLISRSRLGEAVARRIAGDSGHSDFQVHLDALQDEVAGLRAQLGEAQERLDFAERLLTKAAEPRPPLPGAHPDSRTQ